MWKPIAYVECRRCGASIQVGGVVPGACRVCGASFRQGAGYCAIRACLDPTKDPRDHGERECNDRFCSPGERSCAKDRGAVPVPDNRVHPRNR